MTAIQINVSRNMDGVTYSLLPSIRKMIKKMFPSSQPANRVFVAYDLKNGLEKTYVEPLQHIYPALIGVSDVELGKKLDSVEFVDSETGKVLKKMDL
ncbi:MAG: hypothetical protein KBH07_11435 [Flavobacteriales bacterium]|nr:hypothetical protein [Flavobacteriales bacterium]MBP9080460.1 hypothetical protein [Flavobacteriales bacterium]